MNEQTNVPRPTDRSAEGDDAVGRLLRLAGHRPAVPARDAAIVKEAARAEWRRAVKAQRRKKLIFGGAGGLLAAAATLLLVLNPRIREAVWPGPEGPIAAVVATAGNVVISGRQDDALVAGAVVETAAEGREAARAVLELADGSTIRVDAGTRLELLSASILDLERGAVFVDSGPASGSLEVRTPLGVARDIGTRFEVRLEPDSGSLLLRVRDGVVELARGEDVHRALAGDEIEVSASGTVKERPLLAGSLYWLGEVLPAYPDGIGLSPVSDFLEWAVEEGGLASVDYADADAEALCSSTQRSGPVAGLSLDVVVTYALPSQLEHRLSAGRLVIDWKRADSGTS